jgi:protocatechuate 3,4-dioxygenase beta subunit
MTRRDDARLLTRRQTLAAGAAASAGLMISPALSLLGLEAAPALASAISLTPEQEEGPYYVALEQVRKSIVAGQAGVPLGLTITVLDSTTGAPLEGAALDVWQCSPLGIYSDEASENSLGKTFLRGVQLTDASGRAELATLYPGHYAGRATHIHVKLHVGGAASAGSYSGGHVAHTGQLFFSDVVSTAVFKLAPYRKDSAARVLNTADRVYTEQGGSKSEVKLKRRGAALAKGFTGTVVLAVDPSSTPAAVGTGTGGGSGTAAPGGSGAR